MKKKLSVSVSGGRTSAYMAHWLKKNKSDEYDMVFIFANTGQEHPDTLRFLHDVDKNFGLNLVWVEAKVNTGRKSTSHTVVSYETASRNGSPFENIISKYGLPNQVFKHCSRELKLRPITSYVKNEIGWKKGEYESAIGIRYDEARRVSEHRFKNNIIYPLVDMNPVDKSFVIEWFSKYEWDLKIPEYLGNCLTCYKKSTNKLGLVYETDPSYFDFFSRMDKKYGFKKPLCDTSDGPRKIFRGYRTTEEMISYIKTIGNFSSNFIEENSECSESCEPFVMNEGLF